MPDVFEEVMAHIRAGVDSDHLTQAGDLLLRHQCPSYKSGDAAVDATDLTDGQAIQLRDALRAGIRSEPDIRQAASLAWALSKATAPEPPDVFRELLVRAMREIAGAQGALFQALVALDNSGELEREGRSSMSLANYETNLELARAYLGKHGIVIPY